MSRPFLDLGEGVEVRWLEPSDAEAVYAVVDLERERLSRRMPWAAGATVATTRAFIEGNRSGDNLDALGIYVDGAYAGGIGARPDPLHGDCEIGYWISAPFERRGLVSRATAGLIRHLFLEIGVHRVTIRAAPDNERSRAVPERLGFTYEGTMREAGWSSLGYHDLGVYGLLSTEWSP